MTYVLFYYILLKVFLLSMCSNNTGPVQCLDGCTSTPSLLGQDSTIGDCCGVQGRNAGGFLIAGAPTCTNCTRFRILTARTLISSLPMAPTLDSDVNVSCIVQIEELICPSGMLSLQLPNGSVIIKEIISSVTEIELRINTISLGDFGRYYCNISVTSPQFPNIGLRAFEGIHLKASLASVTQTPMTTINGLLSSDIIEPTVVPSVPEVSSTATTIKTSTIAASFDTIISLPTSVDIMPTPLVSDVATDTIEATILLTDIVATPTTSIQSNIIGTLTSFTGTSPIFTSGNVPLASTMILTSFSTFTTDNFISITTNALPTPTVTPTPTPTLTPNPTSSRLPLPSPSPVPPDISIFCLKLPIVGKKYKLTCHSNQLDREMRWTSRNDEMVKSSPGIQVGKKFMNHFLGVSGLTIYFNPFLVKHIGNYTCWSDSFSVTVSISVEDFKICESPKQICYDKGTSYSPKTSQCHQEVAFWSCKNIYCYDKCT